MDKSVFFEAFAQAGLLDTVIVESGPQTGKEFKARYREPSQVVFDGMAQSTDYAIRYQLADATLTKDTRLAIAGKHFTVLQKPQAVGDGRTFAIVTLGVVK